MSDKAKKIVLTSSSAKMAIGVLAVDNIHVSEFGLSLLKEIEDGKLTHAEAKLKVKEKALLLVSKNK